LNTVLPMIELTEDYTMYYTYQVGHLKVFLNAHIDGFVILVLICHPSGGETAQSVIVAARSAPKGVGVGADTGTRKTSGERL